MVAAKRPKRTAKAPPVEDNTQMGQVLALLQNVAGQQQALTDRLATLEEKVSQQAQAVPTFQPMAAPEGIAPRPDVRDLQKGESKLAGKQLPVMNGLLMPNYQPAYQDGDRVKLNPDGEQGQSLVQQNKRSDYEGTIVGLHQFNPHRQEMKYRVDFPGLTRGKRGDGFYESDLLPI